MPNFRGLSLPISNNLNPIKTNCLILYYRSYVHFKISLNFLFTAVLESGTIIIGMIIRAKKKKVQIPISTMI